MSGNFWGVWVPVGGVYLIGLLVAGLIFWSERRRYLRNPPPWIIKR